MGWGYCPSCTPHGWSLKWGRGTIIVLHFPKWPHEPPNRCLLGCPKPKGGKETTEEGVEDEPPEDQPTVEEVDDEPGETESPTMTIEPATTSSTSSTASSGPSTASTSSSASSADPVATPVVIYPRTGDDTNTNGRLRSSLYDLVGQSAVYESSEDDDDQEIVEESPEIPESFTNTLTLFWLTNLTAAQLQNPSSYKDIGVSLNNQPVEL